MSCPAGVDSDETGTRSTRSTQVDQLTFVPCMAQQRSNVAQEICQIRATVLASVRLLEWQRRWAAQEAQEAEEADN